MVSCPHWQYLRYKYYLDLQTGLVTVNGLTLLLILRTLPALCLLILLEHATLTGLHWYKRFIGSQTLDEAMILLAMTWILSFTDLKKGWQTLDNGGKLFT